MLTPAPVLVLQPTQNPTLSWLAPLLAVLLIAGAGGSYFKIRQLNGILVESRQQRERIEQQTSAIQQNEQQHLVDRTNAFGTAGAHWSNEAVRLSKELHTLAERFDKATSTPPPAAAAKLMSMPANTGVTNAPSSPPPAAPATNTKTNEIGGSRS